MNQYNCPYCTAYLNVNGYVTLIIKKKHGKKGVILMSEELGDYSIHLNPELKFKTGEKTEFYCPCCGKSLEFKHDENKVRIFKTDENGVENTVIFSALFGEQSTYQLSEERQLSFGENAMKYLNPTWYQHS